MKIKPDAILFDLDGVLVDSLDAWWSALNAAFEEYKIDKLTRKEFIDKYWGHDLFYNFRINKMPVEVGLLCNKIYGNHVNKVRIYPDSKDTLTRLSNYKKGLITNTPKDSALKILKNFRIRKFFEIVLTSDDVKTAKPDPEIVIKSCEQLNINPSSAVLIGDTDSDVIAGKKADCKVIGINVDADYTVKTIGDILNIIDI
jgi:phosphoglycolate phosphatase/pyrophosphatase PpaX